jgi:uncharacterized SAM-binding protein YcdF (DUF218 family)
LPELAASAAALSPTRAPALGAALPAAPAVSPAPTLAAASGLAATPALSPAPTLAAAFGLAATPALSPAIVIFGAAVRPGGHASGALRRRVEAALAFGRRQADPLYVPTGGVGTNPPAEAEVMARLLRAGGVADGRILIEDTGTDTVSSVRAVRRVLLAAGHAGPVRVATSAYHLPRCVLLLRLAGLPARACPPPPWPAATDWRKRWFWRLREVPAVPWDAAIVVWLRAVRRL